MCMRDKASSSIIDQHIDSAPRIDGLLNNRLDLVVLTYVTGHRFDRAPCLANPVGNWTKVIHCAARDHDLRATATKLTGNIRTDARAAASYNRYFSSNIKSVICHLRHAPRQN